jgi:hypothetical protein
MDRRRNIKTHIAKIAWLFLLLALTLTIVPVSVSAVNVTNATYLLIIRITNNGTVNAYNVSVPVTLNTSNFVNNDYIWSNLTNSAMKTNTGTNGYYNPAVLTNTTWMMFVPAVPANSVIDYALYIGGNTPMSGNTSYFAGTAGMTTADNASLELGNNFSITQVGWLDASNSTAGHNLINKPGAIVANMTGDGNVSATVFGANGTTISATGISPGPHTINIGSNGTTFGITVDGVVKAAGCPSSQNYTENNTTSHLHLYGDEVTRGGIIINNFPTATINSLGFYLRKVGLPTGNAYFRVRKASDDSIVGTLGELDVSTISSPDYTWYFCNSPVINSQINNLRFSIEYNGGDISNLINLSHNVSTPLYGNETLYYLGPNWLEYDDDSITFQLNFGSVDVPNTANAWVFAQNSTWPYLESQIITINGVQRQSVGWQNAAIFIDQSGGGNHATPTFRTTATSANVSAALVGMDTISQALATNWTIGSYSANAVGNMPDAPPEMFGELSPTFPGASAINEIETAAGVPISLVWFLFPLVVILIIGLVILKFTQSIMAEVIIVGVCTLLISLIHIWPLWILLPYLMIAGACVLADKVNGY